MISAEKVHRYPRWLRYAVEMFCALLALLAIFNLGQALLQFLWDSQGLSPSLKNKSLVNFVSWLNQTGERGLFRSWNDLIPSFVWFAVLMTLVMYVRNFFPTIRTSSHGMLVEWGNTWMPVAWESVKKMQVTEDLAGTRFVLLTQTNNKALSGWHRVYSFLYRFGFKRGVLITSAISEFMPLVQTMLREVEQEARHTSQPPVTLDEQTRSPLFQLVLSPAGFFSPRSKEDKEYTEQAAQESRSAQPGRVTRLMAMYPGRFATPLVVVSALIALFGLFAAFGIFAVWMSTQFPGSRSFVLFNKSPFPAGTAVWWAPIAALLLLGLLVPLLIVLRNALPSIETRPEGLAVRFFNRWLLIPWSQLTAVKTVELDDDNRLVLIQATDKALTLWHRFYSLIFEGSTKRGVWVLSAIEPFDAFMQQLVLEVSRNKRASEHEEGLLNEDAPVWPARFLFKPSENLDKMVDHYDKDAESQKFSYTALIAAATPMLWISGVCTAILLVSQLINNVLPPSPQRLIGAALFFVFCMIEWLLAATLAKSFEQNSAADAHQNRPFYMYPLVQLPRILPLLVVLILVLLGVHPFVAMLFWLGAAIWSFLLTAGLWDSMYDWDSTKLLVMGAVPAVYQVVMMFVWLSAS